MTNKYNVKVEIASWDESRGFIRGTLKNVEFENPLTDGMHVVIPLKAGNEGMWYEHSGNVRDMVNIARVRGKPSSTHFRLDSHIDESSFEKLLDTVLPYNDLSHFK